MHTPDPALPQVIDDCHELLKWLIPLLDQFPRSRRFTLGERLESGLLAVLDRIGSDHPDYSHQRLASDP